MHKTQKTGVRFIWFYSILTAEKTVNSFATLSLSSTDKQIVFINIQLKPIS